MRNASMFLLMLLLLTVAATGATDSVESPKTCTKCGMDRTFFAQSRMLIVYADGTSRGVCSIHCAAAELQHNRNKRVSSIMAADYYTKKLLDAGTAAWVVGGRKSGVMTSLAKWAFARTEDARRFVDENGGTLNSFDQAMNSATLEVMDQDAEEKAVENEMLREQQ